jgi:hypothetical protein
MPKRISLATANALIVEAQSKRTSQRQLADRFEIARRTVWSILHDPAGERYKRDGVLVAHKPVAFKPTRPYYCTGCEREITVRPCPACLAREARKNGAKSAVAGMKGSKPEAMPTQPNQREDIPWIEIPPAVADWFHAKLSHMIGLDGHRADVADAIEEFSGQVRNLIAAQANTIGEERREQCLRESNDGKKKKQPFVVVA